MHRNIILYETRPFKDEVEMTTAIVNNWCKTIHSDDKVFHLGDVALCGFDTLHEIMKKLPGRIYLIKGNHDRGRSNQWYRDVGFDEVYDHPIMLAQFDLILSHEPAYMNDKMPYRNIHGHIHSRKMEGDLYFNASVEHINYTPVKMDDIFTAMKWVSE